MGFAIQPDDLATIRDLYHQPPVGFASDRVLRALHAVLGTLLYNAERQAIAEKPDKIPINPAPVVMPVQCPVCAWKFEIHAGLTDTRFKATCPSCHANFGWSKDGSLWCGTEGSSPDGPRLFQKRAVRCPYCGQANGIDGQHSNWTGRCSSCNLAFTWNIAYGSLKMDHADKITAWEEQKARGSPYRSDSPHGANGPTPAPPEGINLRGADGRVSAPPEVDRLAMLKSDLTRRTDELITQNDRITRARQRIAELVKGGNSKHGAVAINRTEGGPSVILRVSTLEEIDRILAGVP